MYFHVYMYFLSDEEMESRTWCGGAFKQCDRDLGGLADSAMYINKNN